ncbi:MAG TPA: S8 family serine peptidase, partial [Steroidobacteraceae bacterium]|nr:S8 family serine peptidase [Steroidobacteraceae bacterium]
SCGAIFFNDTIAAFSSNGPSSDGRIKPDIVAPGVGIATMHADNTIGYAGGTSLSTPLVAGACVLAQQAHPEASAMQIRTAVLHSGILFDSTSPNNVYGYGRIDAYNAALKLGTIIGRVKLSRTDSVYSVCVPIAANNRIKKARIVYALNIGGSYSHSVPLSLASDSLIYSATFPPLRKGTHVHYYIEATDGADTATLSPRNATDSVYDFYIGDTIPSPPFAVKQTTEQNSFEVFPNPASNTVTIAYTGSQALDCSLIDNLGRTVASFFISQVSETLRLRLDDIPNGSYVLKAVSYSGGVLLRTLVVAK